MANLANEKTPLLSEKQFLSTDPKNVLPNKETTEIKHCDQNDYHDKKRHTKYWRLPVLCILVCEMCERMTFFSISGNMVIFCTNVLYLTSAQALVVQMIFLGLSFFLPVIGGLIADTISGRYNAIFAGGLLFALGSLLLSAVAFNYSDVFENELLGLPLSIQRLFFFISLLLVAAGTGGIKSNTSPFGANQVEHMGSGMVDKFFHWYYWFINIGGLISFTVLVYVQQEVDFALGYIITTSCMIVAVVVFYLPHSYYMNKKTAKKSQLVTFYQIVYYGISSKIKEETSEKSGSKYPSFLDYSCESHGGPYKEVEVEEVRTQIRMFPIFICGCVYAATYTQVSSTFVLQGERLDLQIGNFTFPVASLQLFNIITLMTFVPLFQKVVFPLLARLRLKPTILQRLGFGFFMGAVSMFIAGGLELIRKKDLQINGVLYQEVAGVMYNASHISIFAQVPQYIFVGTGEMFTAISGLELAYSQAPHNAQGIIIGFYLLCTGAGAFLGSILLLIVNTLSQPDPWIPNEINSGHLERYFFLIGGLTAFNGCLFSLYAKYVFKYATYSMDAVAISVEKTKFGTLETTSNEDLNKVETCSSEVEADTASQIGQIKPSYSEISLSKPSA